MFAFQSLALGGTERIQRGMTGQSIESGHWSRGIADFSFRDIPAGGTSRGSVRLMPNCNELTTSLTRSLLSILIWQAR